MALIFWHGEPFDPTATAAAQGAKGSDGVPTRGEITSTHSIPRPAHSSDP